MDQRACKVIASIPNHRELQIRTISTINARTVGEAQEFFSPQTMTAAV